VIRTPARGPNANAFAERWVRTVRSDCLDWILIFGRRHLERVLRAYTRHYNEHRPHRALQLTPPNGGDRVALDHTPRRVHDPSTRPHRRTDPRVPTSSLIEFAHATRARSWVARGAYSSRKTSRTARASDVKPSSRHPQAGGERGSSSDGSSASSCSTAARATGSAFARVTCTSDLYLVYIPSMSAARSRS
jgi:hypothetical protein